MKKNPPLILIFVLACVNVFSQNFLEVDKSKILQPNFKVPLPQTPEIKFANFEDDAKYDNILGLSSKDTFVTTNAQFSTITINKNNIGRVVLYAKLFDTKDSLLFNPTNKRYGKVIIKSFRDNKPINEITSTTDFSEYIFQQIHLTTYKSGIDKVVIEFESKKNRFILDKLKIIPLNNAGIRHYKELEKSEIEILDWSNNLENEASKIKEIYKSQIKRIESSHNTLTNIIKGQIFENMASIKANSLNPFKNQTFINSYNAILDRANAEEKEKIKKLTRNIGSDDFKNIALTMDDLFLSGKFASVINLIGGLFNKNMKIKDAQSNTLDVVLIDGVYYRKNRWGRNKLKLTPIEDKEVLSKIVHLNKQNDAYKSYVSDIATFLKNDTEDLKALSEDITVAKTIITDLEKLTWQIVRNFSDNKKMVYFKEREVSFSAISADLESNFIPEEFKNLTEIKQLRKESIATIKKFNSLLNKYDAITSKIKTHYDLLYEIRPNERKRNFNALEHLPESLNSDWKDKQDDIINEYTKRNGLKAFFTKATGKE